MKKTKIIRFLVVIVVLALLCVGGYFFAIKTSLIWHEDVDEEKYRVRGVAVDEGHGNINWQEVKQKANVSFALIRATTGTAFKDKKYVANYTGAVKAGIKVSLYHEYIYGNDPSAQAKLYVNAVRVKNMELKPAVKFMFDASGLTEDGIRDLKEDVYVMFDVLEAQYDKTPMIYTTEEMYDAVFSGSTFDNNNIVVQNLRFKPMFMDASRWHFWQYKIDGTVTGIPHKVNKLVYTGTPGDFENYVAHTK